MPHSRNVGARRRDPMSSNAVMAARFVRDRGLERRQHALAVSLAKWNEAHAGRNQVRHDAMQERMERGASAMPCPAQAAATTTG